MTDITKCRGRNCGVRKWCLRYTAPASPDRQSWAPFDDDARELLWCYNYLGSDVGPNDRVEEEQP